MSLFTGTQKKRGSLLTVPAKRDLRGLRFELWKVSVQMGLAVPVAVNAQSLSSEFRDVRVQGSEGFRD